MGYPSLTPSFEGNLRTQGHEILSRKTKDVEATHSEDFVILGVAVLIQCQGVTDGRTDGQTPRPQAISNTRETFCYRAQKSHKHLLSQKTVAVSTTLSTPRKKRWTKFMCSIIHCKLLVQLNRTVDKLSVTWRYDVASM